MYVLQSTAGIRRLYECIDAINLYKPVQQADGPYKSLAEQQPTK
jgi:hypothetical protein